ncbi:MAG TPA: nucleoside phosphorylase [Victivallales bacterium]|nr:nucleoside phosphorylase [Victivallales bacterium]
MKKVKEDEKLYHIGLSNDMIENADYAVLINDKQFIEPIAKILDKNSKYINENREYFSYLSTVNGHKVLVVSTGLGGPAMGIGIEEFATIGLKYFIRLGDTGALQFNMNIGDLVLSKAAMRMEGTSRHYAPENYPAVASLEMTNTFLETLKYHNIKFHYGVTVTTDTFWPAQGRRGYLDFVPKKYENILEEWRRYKILSVDMELSTLFTLCNVFNLEAVAILDVVNRNFENEFINELDSKTRINNWKMFLKDAIEMDMHRRELI